MKLDPDLQLHTQGQQLCDVCVMVCACMLWLAIYMVIKQ